MWVHGYAVNGTNSKFDISIDVVSGNDLDEPTPPTRIEAGKPTALQVCVDPTALEGAEGPLSGVVVMGWKGTTTKLRASVRWTGRSQIYLPYVSNRDMVVPPTETPVPTETPAEPTEEPTDEATTSPEITPAPTEVVPTPAETSPPPIDPTATP